jgi:autotransporter translocation and assembly factor TamB
MRYLRRTLQIAALLVTLIVGIVAVALVVSQTPWFKDWLRRYIVRQSAQYLNGELSIGRLGGSLLFGIELAEIGVRLDGERVITIGSAGVDYNVFQILTSDVIVDDLRIDRPVVTLRRTDTGWNLGRIVKERAQEADREGPGRPISIRTIGISGGTIVVGAPDGAAVEAPERIEKLDARLSFAYEPVRYTVGIEHLSFRTVSPALVLNELAGTIAVRDDDVHVERLVVRTGESHLTIDGLVRDYRGTPQIEMRAASTRLAIDEIARIVPAARGVHLRPAFEVSARGPLSRLDARIEATSEAGEVKGQVTADLDGSQRAVAGSLAIDGLNLAPLLKDPGQATAITGRVEFDLAIPREDPLSGLAGSYRFTGPTASALGFSAADVTAEGRIDGPTVTFDATATAYGTRATAAGSLVRPTGPDEGLRYAVRGQAAGLDLRRLPQRLNVPALASDLDLDYQLEGSAGRIAGNALMRPSTLEGAAIAAGTRARVDRAGGVTTFAAKGRIADLDVDRVGRVLDVAAIARRTLDASIAGTFDVSGSVGGKAPALAADATLERSRLLGATFAPGTTVQFRMNGTDDLRYAAQGEVAGLDLQQVGRGLGIEALAADRYAGEINGRFRVEEGRGSTLDTLHVNATGTLENTRLLGGEVPRMEYAVRFSDGTLAADVDGRVDGIDPAVAAGNRRVSGSITGTVDAAVTIAGLGEGDRVEIREAGGRVQLETSTINGFEIRRAVVDGSFTGEVARVKTLDVAGRDATLTATGTLALDRDSSSDLAYRVQASRLESIGRLVDLPLGGAASAEGRVTGNGAALITQGTLSGSSLSYGDTEALSLKSEYTVQVPDLTFARASIRAETDATFLELAGRELTRLSATTTYQGETLEFKTTIAEPGRELQASGSLLLHTDHREVHLTELALSARGARWTIAPASEAVVQYGAGEVRLGNVTLTSGDQRITAQGTIATGERGSGVLTIDASNLDLAQLDALTLGDRGLAGRLDAVATLAGRTAAPELKGRLTVTNGAIRGYTYQSLAAGFGYTNAGLELDARLDQSPGQWLTARGTVPLTLFRAEPTVRAEHVAPGAGDRVDLVVQSSPLDLALLQAFTPQIADARGTLQVDVHVAGSGRDPHLQGTIDFTGGAFSVPELGISLTGLDSRIELQPDKVVIPALHVLDGHGHPLTISGELALHERQVGAVDISITADSFEVIDNDLGDVGVDAALKLTGELRRPRVEGLVELESARLEVDRILELTGARAVAAPIDVTPIERQPITGAKPEPAIAPPVEDAAAGMPPAAAPASPPAGQDQLSVFKALALDVRVTIDNNMVLRGTDLRGRSGAPIGLGDMNVTVGGDVRVRKAAGSDDLGLVGTVNTVRGTYDFQGRRFEIQRDGRIQFQGLPVIDPAIDVTATRLISGVEARVRVRGTLRKPELLLSSNPPLDEADVLSLIVFNQPINQLGEGQRVSLAERAGSLAAGFVATPLAEQIGRALDLDVFEIQTSAGEGALGPRVTVGQQVSDRIFVRFSQQFGAYDVSEFALEYQIADFLRLQTSIAEGGGRLNRSLTRRVERGGVDLIFFFSY